MSALFRYNMYCSHDKNITNITTKSNGLVFPGLVDFILAPWFQVDTVSLFHCELTVLKFRYQKLLVKLHG